MPTTWLSLAQTHRTRLTTNLQSITPCATRSRKMRQFLMNAKGLSEDEAITLMSVAADFGVTQVVDGNWGVHGIIPKGIFP